LQLSGAYRERSYSSWVGRVNYILMDKYIFNASIRADGSSKLGGKWEQFPSIGAAWRISDENFIKETAVSTVLSNLKFRAAWGNSGNDDVEDYATQMRLAELNQNSYYSWNGTATDPAYSLGDMMGNKDLLWEKTNTLDFGLDLGLFKNRINLTFDYYDAKTTDLLFPFDLPATTGTKQINKNFGSTRNKGFEILLETRNIATKDFLWNTTVTFTKNKETIVALPEDKSVYATDYRNSKIIGYPAVVFYSYINDGIWQIDEADEAEKYNAYPGDLKIRDISGPDGVPDGKIDPVYDRTVIGKVAPDWYGSISNDLSWKGFDLNIFMTFRVGSWITSDYWAKYNAGNGSYNNGVVVNYWTPENTTGVYPRPGKAVNGEYLSMLSLKDNSFFKIRNITLGYTLPKQLTERYNVGKLRVWASVKNALIFAKEPTSFDPENEGIIDQPLNKLMTFGLNVEF
jgi:TonB-linked SusC/RagA family outer membrane protein